MINMKIKDVLDQIGQDVLSEDTKKTLQEAFDEVVNATVTEKVNLEVEAALKKLDEDHAVKLEKLLESIDEDHVNKLHAVIAKIDEDHTKKLQYIVSHYKKILAEDASDFKNKLSKQVNDYLSLYVSEKLPTAEIKEAVQNVKARRILEKVKQVVAVDEEFINETIREAVEDGRNTIENLRSELSDTVKANIAINQEMKATKAELLIEKSTAGFPKHKKDYVARILRDKDPDFITENFEQTVKMFERDEEDSHRSAAEVATKNTKTMSGKIDVPASKVKDSGLLTESAPTEKGSVGGYLKALESQDNRFKRS